MMMGLRTLRRFHLCISVQKNQLFRTQPPALVPRKFELPYLENSPRLKVFAFNDKGLRAQLAALCELVSLE
jgi:hypothetical protein